MSLLVYLAGGALLAVALHAWRPGTSWASSAGYWLLSGLFFAAPLTADYLQAATDIPYLWGPLSETLAGRAKPANLLLGDVPFQMIPLRAVVRDHLFRLEAPLWAHGIGTGEPLLGDAQSAPFSPIGLMALPLPVVRSLPVMAALRLFLSLILADALLRELGAGRAGCLFGALAFSFSVYSTCWALHPHAMAAAWLPGLLLGILLLHREEPRACSGLVACACGLALSGHPETLAHAALASLIVTLALLVQRPKTAASPASPTGLLHPRRVRFVARLAAATAITAGLTAPVILPILGALPESVRSAALRQFPTAVQPAPLTGGVLRVLVNPFVYGSPRDGNWQGPWNYNELCSGYAGLLTLALALAAAVALRGRFLAIFAAGTFAAAAAFSVPPFLGWVHALPLLDHAANGRLRLFWVLALAVGAGLAIEPLSAERRGRLALATLAIAAAVGLLWIGPPTSTWQRAWWWSCVGGCLATGVAGLLASLGRRSAPSIADGVLPPPMGERRPALHLPAAERWLPWLAVACLALDLGLLEARYLPVLPAQFDLRPPAALQALQHELRRHPEAPFRVVAPDTRLLPNLAAFYGLWDPRADDPMQPAAAAEVVGRMLRQHYLPGRAMLLLTRPYPIERLSFLGVRYLLAGHDDRLSAPWTRAWEGVGGTLWRNDAALPLFSLPATWQLAASRQAALAATLQNHDFSASAVAEIAEITEAAGVASAAPSSVPSPPSPPLRPPEPDALGSLHHQAGAILSQQPTPNGFSLDVLTATGALLVSSVTHCEGWRLTIDGSPSRILRANAGFLGFLVPPGSHHASLEYRPAGWTWGLRICGLTLVVLLAGRLVTLRRLSARSPDPVP